MTADSLNPSDYRFLAEMLEQEVGIQLEEGKEYLALTRLEHVLETHEMTSLTSLVGKLRKNDRKLKNDVIDAMTVNETLFFRDPNVWGSLRETLLPEVIKRNQKDRTLAMWSAASSSGQEPYSLAIAISELLGPEDASWRIKIDASDLSREMVARTSAGLYSNYEVSRGMEAATRDRHFNERGNQWQVNERLKSRVAPKQANLAAIPPGIGPYDLIMLRNVLIYFSAEIREEVLRNMAGLLKPGGYLLLGASEGALGVPKELVPVRLSGLVAFHSVAAEAEGSEAEEEPTAVSELAESAGSRRASDAQDRPSATAAARRRSAGGRAGGSLQKADESPAPAKKHSLLGGFRFRRKTDAAPDRAAPDRAAPERAAPERSSVAASRERIAKERAGRERTSPVDRSTKSTPAQKRTKVTASTRSATAKTAPRAGSTTARDGASAIEQLRAMQSERERRNRS